MQDNTSKRIHVSNKPYLIALNHMQGIGPHTIRKLLDQWPMLQDLFAQTPAQLIAQGLAPSLVHAIAHASWHAVENDLEWQASLPHHHLITWCDAVYPDILLEITDPPPVLYAMGQLHAFSAPMLAMIGSRKPSVSGEETAFQFAKILASHHITIVSGLALGIDAAAHRGCLAQNGTTIAVLGSGIQHIYPRQHQGLAAQICEKGLVLSEFSRQSSPISGHFPRRNRIISGLASIILVVEAAIKSGSLITARCALEQNRDVLAIPGSIHNLQTAGCHYLLKQGAKLVTSVQDVLEEFPLNAYPVHKIPPNQLVTLASEEQNLVKCIGFETTSTEQIFKRCGGDLEQLMCRLVNLELQGVIRAVPGGYMRCM